jgi:hypothetical protein
MVGRLVTEHWRLMTTFKIISFGSLLPVSVIFHLLKLNRTGSSGLGDKPQ